MNIVSNRTYFYLLLIILFAGAFLRLYKLGEIPNGLYQDETAIAYNAFSIRETGKDEHGRFFPLYFESFGDQKLPVYIYATVLSQLLFGMNEFSTRFPSALFGIASLPALYVFVYSATKNKSLALVSSGFLAVAPWHIHYSRATFEVSLVLCFLLWGSYFLQTAFQQNKKGYFFTGTLAFILAMYSYNLTRILSPLLFFGMLILHQKNIHHINKTEKIVTGVFGTILLLPFILTLLTSGGASSASGTLLHSSAAVQAPLLELKSYMIEYPLLSTLFFNKYILTATEYIKHIAAYFSASFFFLSGSEHGNHGIGTNGQFYLFEFPLMIIGAFVLWKRQRASFIQLLLPAVLTIALAAYTRESPHATRSFTLLMTLPVFSAAGFLELYRLIRNRFLSDYRYITTVSIIGGLLFIFLQISSFASSYFIRFPVAYAKQWRSQDKDVAVFIQQEKERIDTILIDTEAGLIYTSLLFYLKISPVSFQQSAKRLPPDSEGFTQVVSFDQIQYKKINWDTDYKMKKTIIITNKRNIPEHIPVYKTFDYPNRPVVLSKGQEIIIYPAQDTAYVAVKTQE